jgi:hypothetical protein
MATRSERKKMMKVWGIVAVLAVLSVVVFNTAKNMWKARELAKRYTFVPQGENPYFILKPGYVMEYRSEEAHLVVTVLGETKIVDGVETRVVEERETHGGELEEVSRNYFAISRETGAVCYFGEDVDIFRDGKLTEHGGSWLSGSKDAKYGVLMPGQPAVGQKYYQENAVGVAQDHAEILSVTESIVTKAGEFKNCVKTEETSPLEPGHKEYKVYAPGVGLVKDSELLLIKYGFKK